VWNVGDSTLGPAARDMPVKKAMASAGPSQQAVEGGARASAARNPFSGRSGTGVPRCRNSSSRWRASSGPNAPDRTRSVAAARARWGARGFGAPEAEEMAVVTALENRARDDMAARVFGRLVPPSLLSFGERSASLLRLLYRSSARARATRLGGSGSPPPADHRGLPPAPHRPLRRRGACRGLVVEERSWALYFFFYVLS
jgi:hypothetical protein